MARINVITCAHPHCNARTFSDSLVGWSRTEAAERGGKFAYLCPTHSHECRGYTHENDARRGAGRTGFTYSWEFEVDEPTRELHNLLTRHEFVRTEDCTVDAEYKSPIWEDLMAHRLLPTIEKCLRDGGGVVSSRCGTHCHVGHREFITPETIRWVACYYHEMFDELSAYLAEHPQECREVFGRRLGRWANDARGEWAYEHTNFINVQHGYTLEYRVCKFVTAAQYEHAIKFCKEATKAVINRFIKNYAGASDEVIYRKAKAVSKHLVKLFQRFHEQRPR